MSLGHRAAASDFLGRWTPWPSFPQSPQQSFLPAHKHEQGSCPLPGEAIPHYPRLLKADPRHWWASFSGGKSMPPSWPQCWSPQGTRDLPSCPPAWSPVCSLAREALGLQQPGGQPSETNCRPLSWGGTTNCQASFLPRHQAHQSPPHPACPSLQLGSLQPVEAVGFLVSKHQGGCWENPTVSDLSHMRALLTPHNPAPSGK